MIKLSDKDGLNSMTKIIKNYNEQRSTTIPAAERYSSIWSCEPPLAANSSA